MQIYAHDHVEVHPQKKKEVLYLIKKKKKIEQWNIMEIDCEVLWQELNKHLLLHCIVLYCIYLFATRLPITIYFHSFCPSFFCFRFILFLFTITNYKEMPKKKIM